MELNLWKVNKDGCKNLYFYFWTARSSVRKKLYSQKDPISDFILSGNVEGRTGVFIFKGCHNKGQHTGWLKTGIYFLQKPSSPDVWNQGISRTMLLLRLWVEPLLPPWLLEGTLSPRVLGLQLFPSSPASIFTWRSVLASAHLFIRTLTVLD